MKNRNYFNRPIQSDRNRHDYGNTKLNRDPEFTLVGFILGFGAIVLLAVVAVLIITILSSPRP